MHWRYGAFIMLSLSISTSLNDMSTYHPVHPTLQAAYIHLHVHIQPTDL